LLIYCDKDRDGSEAIFRRRSNTYINLGRHGNVREGLNDGGK
jgi:hypothetical protein